MKLNTMIGLLLMMASAVAAEPDDGAVTAAVPQPADIKTRAEAVVTMDRNARGPDKAAAIADALRLIQDREIEPNLLATYDTRTLEVLFEAVRIASDLSQRPGLLQALEDIFTESLRRGFRGRMDGDLYARFVRQRQWQKARKLNERFPSKDGELPDIVEPAAPREGIPAVYLISKDGGTLSYKPVDLAGPIIVSVVSPGCHYCDPIVRRIEADPKLAALFRDHAINIDPCPSPFRMNTAKLARVNQEGRFRYAVLYRESDWRGFDFSSTPQFYFVKGGEIVQVIRSVQPDEFTVKLAEGLAKIGL